MVGPAVKREAVAHLRAVMGLSERRACHIVAIDRTTVRYTPKAVAGYATARETPGTCKRAPPFRLSARCASAGPDPARSERGRRSLLSQGQMHAGR
jgi:hypothetical protein